MDLKATLDLLTQYTNIKKISLHDNDIVEVEFFEAKPLAQTTNELIKALGTDNMPSDDAMLFASTPFFDEMVKTNEDNQG